MSRPVRVLTRVVQIALVILVGVRTARIVAYSLSGEDVLSAVGLLVGAALIVILMTGYYWTADAGNVGLTGVLRKSK